MTGPVADELWLVTGASGVLGHHLCRRLAVDRRVVGVRHGHGTARSIQAVRADLTAPGVPRDLVTDHRPTHVVHAAAITDVDACEADEAAAERLHVEVSAELAEVAAACGAAFVLISTDQLWTGERGRATEATPIAPINVYARTKAMGEQAVLAVDPSALVVRTNFFGRGQPWRRSASDIVLDTLAAGREYGAFTDVWFTPIAVSILCELLLAAAERRVIGPLHLAGGQRVSKHAFARAVARAHGYPASLVVERSVADAGLSAPRPRDMSLDCSRAEALFGQPMPDLDTSIEATRRPGGRTSLPRSRTWRGP